MDEIGCVFGVSVCGNMKPTGFFMYPCRGAKAYAPKMSLAEGLGLKQGGFLGYPYWEG